MCGGVRLRLRAIELSCLSHAVGRGRGVGESESRGLGNADIGAPELHYVCIDIARSAAQGLS